MESTAITLSNVTATNNTATNGACLNYAVPDSEWLTRVRLYDMIVASQSWLPDSIKAVVLFAGYSVLVDMA
jgi:hypothetical protein